MRKIEVIIPNKGTYALHFYEKVRENTLETLMKKIYVIIRRFGVW